MERPEGVVHRVAGGLFVLSIGLLAADAFVRDEDLVNEARWLLGGLALVSAVLWLATTATLRPHFHSFHLDTAGPGFAIRVLPPEKGAIHRLKIVTDEVVKDIYTYLGSMPYTDSGFFEMGRAMEQAESDQDRNRIWVDHINKTRDASAKERTAISKEFGGRVHYLLTEYESRGLLSDEDKRFLMWSLNSNHWLVEVAVRLESLRHQL